MNVESTILKFLAAEMQLKVLPAKVEEAETQWSQLLNKECPAADCPVQTLQRLYPAWEEVEKLRAGIAERQKELEESEAQLLKVLRALGDKQLVYTYVLSSGKGSRTYHFRAEGDRVKHNHQEA